MYNRYIQSDRGSYIPITEDPPPQSHQDNTKEFHSNHDHKEHEKSTKRTASLEGLKDFWNTLAGRLHLDAGDLILLAMLYFLYREHADEELLIALGLLLLL